jgi:hypothetical protein
MNIKCVVFIVYPQQCNICVEVYMQVCVQQIEGLQEKGAICIFRIF